MKDCLQCDILHGRRRIRKCDDCEVRLPACLDTPHIQSQYRCGIGGNSVDELIISAESRDQLVTRCRALDRVLQWGYYVVPNWYVARHRVSYWNKFNRPETLPLYYNPIQALMTWWMK